MKQSKGLIAGFIAGLVLAAVIAAGYAWTRDSGGTNPAAPIYAHCV